MKAIAVYPGQKGSVHLRDVEKPSFGGNEILVKNLYAGICGTDREINEGLYGEAPVGDDYLILGHESVGVIENLGSNVLGSYEVGDYVVRTVRRSCGCCENCFVGHNDMCSTGDFTEAGIKGVHGGMAEYVVDVPDYLVKVPEELKNVAVLLEPLSVVEKATREALK
ncbi:MAG: alcohol dehydrogenase catalytic domain-containing protein, partial [archaeon]